LVYIRGAGHAGQFLRSRLVYIRGAGQTTWLYTCIVFASQVCAGEHSTASQSSGHKGAGEVQQFVRQMYIEGVPYEVGSRFTSADVPTLLTMLSNSAEERYWSNIVLVLGMIGDPAAVAPLVTLLERGDSRTMERYRAQKAVLPALGYLVQRSGDERALSYLQNSLSPGIWDKRRVTMVRPGGREEVEMKPDKGRDLELSRMAIIGLSLSGHRDAETTLRALQAGKMVISREFGSYLQRITDQAVNDSQIIRREGLDGYYKGRRTEIQQPAR